MKIDHRKSKDVIDRRRSVLAVVGLAIVGALAIAIGVAPPSDPEQPLVDVVSTAIDRGQAFWSFEIPRYRRAKVVLYRDAIGTPCGRGSIAVGPFYCEADERIYIDLSFLAAIQGELARAYVIAHELGHHVQLLRGERGDGVGFELQADCYAGRWIAREIVHDHVTHTDIDAALEEARAVGDDRLVPGLSPEQFTHGSSEQRHAALARGIRGETCPAF